MHSPISLSLLVSIVAASMKIFIILALNALSVTSAFARVRAHDDPSFQFQEGAQAQLDPRITTTSAPQCRYEIVVQTGDIPYAGTDATISLTVSGGDGTTLSIKDLTSWGEMGPGYDYFEQGQTDVFGGSSNCVTPEPCRMLLESDNSGKAPGWYVENITITQVKPDFTQVTHNFEVNRWLAKDESPYRLYAYRHECSPLRFRRESGTFKVVQVADMHYANGPSTGCLDVPKDQKPWCSDLNTTTFLYRVFHAEDPDLVVFTGDNIYGADSTDAAKSMDAAMAPAIDMKLPWAAVLGNHDQEGTLLREHVMRHLVRMNSSLSGLNPAIEIDGYGNYNLEISGVQGTSMDKKSVLNLYFLDSGDYAPAPHHGYNWIKASQQVWFEQTSSSLQRKYMNEDPKQKDPAPALVFFHIPLQEFNNFTAENIIGEKQEGVSSSKVNSKFFDTMVKAGDVRAALVGHDHTNDFCGKLHGIQLCYGGGFGYHAYGKAGWSRRARVVSVQLEKTDKGEWGGVQSIKTWKRLDDPNLSTIDSQVLWNRGSNGRRDTHELSPTSGLKTLSTRISSSVRNIYFKCRPNEARFDAFDKE